MPRLKKHAGRKIVPCLSLLVLVVMLVAAICDSSARMRQSNEPASEGQPITPAGSFVIDSTTRQPAVGSLTVDFVRSPDHTGPEAKGRYLLAVNSGFGIQFNAAGNRGQQSLAVIDLNASPDPVVIQNVYFPSPQSVNVGVVFSPALEGDGSYSLYVSGGFENKIWVFRFVTGSQTPITPVSPGPDTEVRATFIDVNGFSRTAPSRRYNQNQAPVYPTGLAISPDGNNLFVANNLVIVSALSLMCAELDGWNGSICQAVKVHKVTKQNLLLIPMELSLSRLVPRKDATTQLQGCGERLRKYISLSGTTTP
jgi:hypothetical protein